MGYRTYIGKITKQEHDNIKNLSIEEVYEFYKIEKDEYGDRYKGVYEFGEKLYEFGKYTEFEFNGLLKPVFETKETQEHWNDEQDFNVLTKEAFSLIIKHYAEKVRHYYEKMLNDFKNEDIDEKEEAFKNIINHIIDYKNEWMRKDFLPYNLEKGEEVSTSWKYEYSIFELVRIYKTFDWENNVMIYYGY